MGKKLCGVNTAEFYRTPRSQSSRPLIANNKNILYLQYMGQHFYTRTFDTNISTKGNPNAETLFSMSIRVPCEFV